MPAPAEGRTGFSSAGCSWSRKPADISLFRCDDWGSRVVSVQSNDQRLLERILEDQHRKLAPDKSRDDFFTFFAADKALQDWDLDKRRDHGRHRRGCARLRN